MSREAVIPVSVDRWQQVRCSPAVGDMTLCILCTFDIGVSYVDWWAVAHCLGVQIKLLARQLVEMTTGLQASDPLSARRDDHECAKLIISCLHLHDFSCKMYPDSRPNVPRTHPTCAEHCNCTFSISTFATDFRPCDVCTVPDRYNRLHISRNRTRPRCTSALHAPALCTLQCYAVLTEPCMSLLLLC